MGGHYQCERLQASLSSHSLSWNRPAPKPLLPEIIAVLLTSEAYTMTVVVAVETIERSYADAVRLARGGHDVSARKALAF